jgi:hypothetical protein
LRGTLVICRVSTRKIANATNALSTAIAKTYLDFGKLSANPSVEQPKGLCIFLKAFGSARFTWKHQTSA